jgi:hypothetical protein
MLSVPDDVLQKRVVCIKCDIDLRFHYEARLILFYEYMDTIKQNTTLRIFP